MENGSPELFDYYIFVYKDKPIATQYIRQKKEFLNKGK